MHVALSVQEIIEAPTATDQELRDICMGLAGRVDQLMRDVIEGKDREADLRDMLATALETISQLASGKQLH